ncbi:hypothetical protein A8O29_017400 [Scandinavium goeteborgense]|nr:hypothetical protein A8O29_017400 [Scandinavium goeteborgense]
MVRILWPVLLSGLCLLILTGCPGPGDRMRLDETAKVNRIGDNVCMNIDDGGGYQPAIISINPRGTPSKEQAFVDNPSLSIKSDQLCIPPSFYHFLDNGKYIVDFVLTSERNVDEPRKFVVGVGVNHSQFYNFPLTDREIARPYGTIEVPEE